MLLDEKQIALNELVVAYREAADHFTDANEYLEGEELKTLFESILEGHTQAADRLSEIVRKTGILPRAQHADREQLHQIVTHMKAAFSEDDRQVFLNDRIEHERQIERLIGESLKVSLPVETQELLDSLLIREFDVLAKLDCALSDCIS